MGPDRYVQQVRTRTKEAATFATDVPALNELLLLLLSRPGRVLAPTGTSIWPALVLDTCHALGGDLEAAVDVAVAMECVAATADVVDDLVDQEWDEALAPSGRAINATLALSFLAQRCAGKVVTRLGAVRSCLINQLLAQGILDACAGEDLDLRLERTSAVTEEDAHEMTRRKSGSFMALACTLGAAVATDEEAILDLVRAFGGHIGIIHQLLNDLAGIDPDRLQRGSDLRQRKKTLPVAFALRCAREEGMEPVLAWYDRRRPAGMPELDETQLATHMRDLGALHYTWVVADAHRRQAEEALQALASLTGRLEVLKLRRLMPDVEAPQPQQAGSPDCVEIPI